jgi:hypothetical protein
MRSILAALVAVCFCVPASAFAELVWKGDGVTIKFTTEECTTASLVMALLQNGASMPIRAATVHVGQNTIPACWGVLEGDKALLIDVFGQGGFIPLADLKPENGV